MLAVLLVYLGHMLEGAQAKLTKHCGPAFFAKEDHPACRHMLINPVTDEVEGMFSRVKI